MSQIFFSADLHLGHKNIIEFCHRPFDNVEQMDQALIDNINRKIEPADTFYYLGDFTFGSLDRVTEYRQRINCKNIHLIKGNHDRLTDKQYQQFFTTVSMLKEIKADGEHITLCHYAMRRWNKSHHGSWHLYGHSHGDLPDDGLTYSFDVGVDCTSYQPLSLAEVRQKMSVRSLAKRNHPLDMAMKNISLD
jgi:calcineurin-like phosphoesterase family protein